MHLKRAQYLPPGPPLQPADFRGWNLSWTTSYLSHMQVDGVQRAPSHPYRNADAAKVQGGIEEEYGKTLMRF